MVYDILNSLLNTAIIYLLAGCCFAVIVGFLLAILEPEVAVVVFVIILIVIIAWPFLLIQLLKMAIEWGIKRFKKQ